MDMLHWTHLKMMVLENLSLLAGTSQKGVRAEVVAATQLAAGNQQMPSAHLKFCEMPEV